MSENLNKKVNEEYKYKSKVKLLELFKFYETDRNLFRVMDETKYVKTANPYKEEEKELKETLLKIKTELTFTKEPKIHILKKENEAFSKNIKKYLKKKNTLGPEDTFREIIEEYKERGYKIPSLKVDHNLFRMNPLIEGNEDKLYDGLYSDFVSLTESKRGKKVAIQTVIYLKKLKNIVEKKIFEIHKNNKDSNKLSINEEVLMPNIKIKNYNDNIKEETNEEILNQIQILLELIKEEPLKDYKTYNPFYSPQKYKPKTINNKYNSNNISKTQSRDFSKKIKDQSLKKITKGTYQNILLNKISKKKEKFYLLSDSKVRKRISNFSIDSPRTKDNLNLKTRNKNNDFLNIHAQTLDNHFNNESNINKGFNSTNYTNRTNHTQNFFYRPKEKSLLQIAYETLVKNNFNKVIETLKDYLKKVKGLSDEKIEKYLVNRSKNSFLNNINEIQNIIAEKKIRKKSEKIYLNEKIIKRIKPKLQRMFNQENLIKKMDKHYIKLFVDE